MNITFDSEYQARVLAKLIEDAQKSSTTLTWWRNALEKTHRVEIITLHDGNDVQNFIQLLQFGAQHENEQIRDWSNSTLQDLSNALNLQKTHEL